MKLVVSRHLLIFCGFVFLFVVLVFYISFVASLGTLYQLQGPVLYYYLSADMRR